MSSMGVKAKGGAGLGGARVFFLAASVVMAVLGVAGFSRFYLQGMAYPGREIPGPIKWIVVPHGLAMTAWLLLVVVQPLLVVMGRRKVHMVAGKVGAVLAGVIVVLGMMVAIGSAKGTPPEVRIWGLPPKQFMAVPFFSILIFAGFVTAGVVYRGKPRVHRALMVLATLSTLAAAVSRIDLFNNLYLGTVWERVFGPFLFAMVLGVLLAIARWVVTRSVDRVLAVGVLGLVLASAGIMWVATTGAWAAVTGMLVG